MSRTFLFTVIFLAGCSSTSEYELSPSDPQVLRAKYCHESDRELAIRAAPIFPRQFLDTGLTVGWVLTNFDISPDGEVTNIKIIDSSPRGYLEKAAVDAVSKFRYVPSTTSSNECNLFTWQRE